MQIIVPIHSGSGQQGQASFPGGKEMKKGELVALLLLPLSLSRSLSLGLSFNLSFSEKSFLEVKNNFFFKGKKQNPNVEGQKQQEVPSQVSDLQVTRTQTG